MVGGDTGWRHRAVTLFLSGLGRAGRGAGRGVDGRGAGQRFRGGGAAAGLRAAALARGGAGRGKSKPAG